MTEPKTTRLTDIAYVKSLMSHHGLHFDKRFGQNFLVNHSVPARIAEECAVSPECGILEIGSGIGALTAELAARYSKVISVEVDRGLLPVLTDTLSEYPNTEIVNADFMSLDLRQFTEEHFHGMEVAVCANLPYYITTPVIMKLLESEVPFKSITLMIQREVAVRLCAQPATPEYGAITAEVAWYCSVKRLFGVSPGSFVPAPKVESAVIRLEPHPAPSTEVSRDEYHRIISAAFAQRRKTLGNALAIGHDKAEVANRLTAIGIDPNRRGETLSPEEFAAAALALRNI